MKLECIGSVLIKSMKLVYCVETVRNCTLNVLLDGGKGGVYSALNPSALFWLNYI